MRFNMPTYTSHPPRGARWPVGGALEVRALLRRSAPAPRASIIIHHAKSRSMSSLRQGEDHCSASAAMSVGVSRTLERQLCLWRGCHCLFVEGGFRLRLPGLLRVSCRDGDAPLATRIRVAAAAVGQLSISVQ